MGLQKIGQWLSEFSPHKEKRDTTVDDGVGVKESKPLNAWLRAMPEADV